MFVGYCLSFFKRNTNDMKQLWLLMERGYDAQDNSWHLFNYIKKSSKINAKYAITKHSKDRINLQEYKDSLIDFGSINYYISLFNAKYIISTHIGTYFPSLWLKGKLDKSFLQPKGKIIFLQHGILHNDIPVLHYYNNKNLSLFICGARNEFELVCKKYKYPDKIVKYTGLARFDNLYEYTTIRQILIMPTWRIEYKNFSDEEFMSTDFYQSYKCILTSEKMKKCLSEAGYILTYINHVEFQKFTHLFTPFDDTCVKVLSFGDRRVQDLLKESDVLITDYSSVYYDFLYMRKPVIFFHLNKDEFYKAQYGIDYDDVSEFGIVTSTYDEVISSIIQTIKNNCQIREEHLLNISKIFPTRDKHNCERIYNEIVNI